MVGNVYTLVIKGPGSANPGALPPLCPSVIPFLDLTVPPIPTLFRRVRAVPGFVIARDRLPSGVRVLSIQKEPQSSARMLVEAMFLE